VTLAGNLPGLAPGADRQPLQQGVPTSGWESRAIYSLEDPAPGGLIYHVEDIDTMAILEFQTSLTMNSKLFFKY